MVKKKNTKIVFFKIKFLRFLDGSCNGDSGLSTFRDSLAAVTKYSRCKPIATVNFVGENFAQASIVSRFELIFYSFLKDNLIEFSIEFDRDYEHFAVAGVSKKIKVKISLKNLLKLLIFF
jgi:hypothetical protein